ncbi:uncharacterized protein LOC105218627 isoform X4 [Zeugodacus cucurbitae]|uniref:uncharacterized protein LOC105218627 isoform X4 n=1 Tax=Zeugodacus cucurbitae TaxID=28588 RepID=UPI000596A93E|nr:uncharacterized protein LOC105218627 isoform X4 [Zeugodacus cucurbitae]
MDAVNWLRLSLLLTLAFLKLSHGIQVTPAPKVANITKTLLQEELLLDTNNGTLVSDSVLSASERNRRLIPYMAFYLPPDFPINQQYAVQGPKGALPHNSKYTKPLAVEGPLPPPVNSGHISLPQEYMNLRAPPPGILGDNGDLAYAAPAPPQQHYLPSAGDVYHQLAYAAAGPAPQPTAMPQHSPPPLSQSLINTKSSKVPVLHLLPPGPPGPTVAPIIKHKHKTVQHFPPTKPPAVQQLPYEQPQPLRQKTNRHNAVHQQQQQQLQLQQQALPVFTSQHELQHQQQQQQQLPVYRQQTRPKQSKVNLTPFTPSNTLPGHFIPIIYTPVNGDDNNNNNNNHDGSNALHYGYDNPTVVLVDDLSPPLQPVNLPQQQQQHQQQQQQPAQFKPISPPHATADNEYTLVSSGVPFEAPRQQQQQQQLQQQYQQQKYITATGAPGDTLAPQQAELPRGPAVSSSPLIPHSTTRPPATQYIDYIVDDPKQSLDDEQQQQQHNIVGTSVPQKPETQQNAFIVISTSTPPLIPPVDDINQDYYEPTRRPVYKQQPALRLQPLPPVNSKHNYATRRPFVPATAPEAQPPPPPPATPEEVIKPKFAYTEPKLNFGDVIKPATTAAKLRPSHKYAGGIGSKLAPLAPPTAPEVTPSTQQHQQEQQQVNLPEYYNPPVPVAAKTTPVLDPNQLPDIRSSSLAEILHKLQASNHLPRTLTPENIDNSIKTLVMILENLKQTQTIVPNPPQHHERPAVAPDYDYGTSSEDLNGAAPDLSSVLSPVVPNKHPGPSTGRAGIDYPNYADIPQTNFNCGEQRYKGFFGDPETNCQVWHYCDLNGGKASFLCPNGTIFSQIALTCDWWFNVKCSTTAQLYVLNERLYKYILPFTPKFPEDYSGPLVDKYLAMKFQEMEEKMRIEKEKVEKTALADVAATTGTETSNNIESDEVSDDGTNTNEHSVDDTDDTDDEDTEVTTVADLRTLPRAMDAHNKHGAVNAHVSEQSSERNLLIDDEVDDIAKRGSVDTFESSTIPTVSAATSANKLDDAPAFSLKPIVVSSTQGPDYEDDANDASAAQHNVRNADEAVSNRLTTEAAQTTTKAQENQIQVQASPKPVRQTSNIDVEKVEVIEIKAEGAAGQLGAKMYYGAESTKEMR